MKRDTQLLVQVYFEKYQNLKTPDFDLVYDNRQTLDKLQLNHHLEVQTRFVHAADITAH